MSGISGPILLLGGVVIGIVLWSLTQKKPKESKRVEVTKPKFYDKEPQGTFPRAPLPPPVPPRPIPPPPEPTPSPFGTSSLYTSDHYRGPMGVAVPIGTIKPNIFEPSPRFVSSVDLDAPGREVMSSWSKLGLLLSNDPEPKILNLYGRPIAPMQDLYQYRVEDKDGFVIPLEQNRFLEQGDQVSHIPGKPGVWKVKLYQTSKYVWM